MLSGRIVLRARAGLRLGTTAGGVAAVGLPLFRAVDAIRAGMRFGIGGDVGGTDTGIPSARPHHRTPVPHLPQVLSGYDYMPVPLDDDRGRSSG